MAQMADGLYVTDRAGLLVYMDGAAERMLGWTADELRGQSVHAAIHQGFHIGRPAPRELV